MTFAPLCDFDQIFVCSRDFQFIVNIYNANEKQLVTESERQMFHKRFIQ